MPEEDLRDLQAREAAPGPCQQSFGKQQPEVSSESPTVNAPSPTQKRREEFYKDCDLDSVRATQDELAASGDELTAPPQHVLPPTAVLDPCATPPVQTATVCDAGGFGSQLTVPTGDSWGLGQPAQTASEQSGTRTASAVPATVEQQLPLSQRSSAPRSTAATQLHLHFSNTSQLSPPASTSNGDDVEPTQVAICLTTPQFSTEIADPTQPALFEGGSSAEFHLQATHRSKPRTPWPSTAEEGPSDTAALEQLTQALAKINADTAQQGSGLKARASGHVSGDGSLDTPLEDRQHLMAVLRSATDGQEATIGTAEHLLERDTPPVEVGIANPGEGKVKDEEDEESCKPRHRKLSAQGKATKMLCDQQNLPAVARPVATLFGLQEAHSPGRKKGVSAHKQRSSLHVQQETRSPEMASTPANKKRSSRHVPQEAWSPEMASATSLDQLSSLRAQQKSQFPAKGSTAEHMQRSSLHVQHTTPHVQQGSSLHVQRRSDTTDIVPDSGARFAAEDSQLATPFSFGPTQATLTTPHMSTTHPHPLENPPKAEEGTAAGSQGAEGRRKMQSRGEEEGKVQARSRRGALGAQVLSSMPGATAASRKLHAQLSQDSWSSENAARDSPRGDPVQAVLEDTAGDTDGSERDPVATGVDACEHQTSGAGNVQVTEQNVGSPGCCTSVEAHQSGQQDVEEVERADEWAVGGQRTEQQTAAGQGELSGPEGTEQGAEDVVGVKCAELWPPEGAVAGTGHEAAFAFTQALFSQPEDMNAVMESVAGLAAQVCGQPASAGHAANSPNAAAQSSDLDPSKPSQPAASEAKSPAATGSSEQSHKEGAIPTPRPAGALADASQSTPTGMRATNAAGSPGHGTQLAAAALQELQDVERTGVKDGADVRLPGAHELAAEPGAASAGLDAAERMIGATASAQGTRERRRPRKHPVGPTGGAKQGAGDVPKRGRGRSRKLSAAEIEEECTTPKAAEQATTSKRGRGRPRKTVCADADGEATTSRPAEQASTPKRGRGRPRKTVSAEADGEAATSPAAEQAAAPTHGLGKPRRVEVDGEATTLPAAEQPEASSRGWGVPQKAVSAEADGEATASKAAGQVTTPRQSQGRLQKGVPAEATTTQAEEHATTPRQGRGKRGHARINEGISSAREAQQEPAETSEAAQKRGWGRPGKRRSGEQHEDAGEAHQGVAEASEAALKQGRGRPGKRRGDEQHEDAGAQRQASEPPRKWPRGRTRRNPVASSIEQEPDNDGGTPLESLSPAARKHGRGRLRKAEPEPAGGSVVGVERRVTPGSDTPLLRDAGASASAPAVSPAHGKQRVLVLLSTGVHVSQATRARAASCHIQVTTHGEGQVVSNFTHYVTTGELILSLHALLALADGRPIVHTSWLDECASSRTVLNPRGFLVHDERTERVHNFSYVRSWRTARKQKLLEGRCCTILDSLIAGEPDSGRGLRLIVGASLGEAGKLVRQEAALAGEGEGLVVVCRDAENKRVLRSLLPEGAVAWTRSQFVKAVAQQSFALQKPYLET